MQPYIVILEPNQKFTAEVKFDDPKHKPVDIDFLWATSVADTIDDRIYLRKAYLNSIQHRPGATVSWTSPINDKASDFGWQIRACFKYENTGQVAWFDMPKCHREGVPGGAGNVFKLFFSKDGVAGGLPPAGVIIKITIE